MRADQDLAKLLEAYVRNARMAIALVDRSHRVRFVNQSWQGFAVAQLLGQPLERLLPEADQARVGAAIEHVFEHGTPLSYESCVVRSSAVLRYRTRLEAVRESGFVTHVAAVSDEITAERRAREEAERTVLGLDRVNRVLFRARSTAEMLDGVLAEMLPLFECDRAFLIYPCDPAASEFSIVHERTVPEFPGALGRILPVDATVLERFRYALAHVGEPLRNDPECNPIGARPGPMFDYGIKSMLFSAITSSYSKPWLFGIHHCRHARVYGDQLALFSAVVARVRDGLETWLSQRALRESEERFRLMVEHAPDAIVIVELDDGPLGRFVTVNEKAVELFGIEREQLLTRGPADVSPEFQRDGAPSGERAQAMLSAALQGQNPVFEWIHRNARGELLECEVRLLRLPDPTHQRVRGSITHIAERKRAERENERLAAQLFQAQKMQALGQLTGGIAHDFNNLLTVIDGSLAIVELDSSQPDRVHQFVQVARDASQRAALLTQRLLAFSRQQPLRPRTIDVAELVRGMEPLLHRSLGETIRIEIATQPKLWNCEVDPAQLENVILNLAINARDAMPRGGTLRIEASNVAFHAEHIEPLETDVHPGEYVKLCVTDSGTGIEPELLDKLFEPFFTTKEVGKGSGLGLSMAYGFARQSGGHIRVSSELARGTTVKLFLPRSARARSELQVLAAESAAIPLGAGECVLIVEDDPKLRSLVIELLNRCGYRTLDVGRGIEALAVLEREREIALLLSDIVLPGGMNGAELARAAQDIRPELPVLFMSGYSENAVIHDGRLDAGVALLEKPFSTAALAKAVACALERRH